MASVIRRTAKSIEVLDKKLWHKLVGTCTDEMLNEFIRRAHAVDEEQERELEQEQEQEIEVEWPPPLFAFVSQVSPEAAKRLALGHSFVSPQTELVTLTSLFYSFGIQDFPEAWNQLVFCSQDFLKTVHFVNVTVDVSPSFLPAFTGVVVTQDSKYFVLIVVHMRPTN